MGTRRRLSHSSGTPRCSSSTHDLHKDLWLREKRRPRIDNGCASRVTVEVKAIQIEGDPTEMYLCSDGSQVERRVTSQWAMRPSERRCLHETCIGSKFTTNDAANLAIQWCRRTYSYHLEDRRRRSCSRMMGDHAIRI